MISALIFPLLVALQQISALTCEPTDVAGIYFLGGSTTVTLSGDHYVWRAHGRGTRIDKGDLEVTETRLTFRTAARKFDASYGVVDGDLWLGVFARRNDGGFWTSTSPAPDERWILFPRDSPDAVTATLSSDLRLLELSGYGALHVQPVFDPNDPKTFFLLFAPATTPSSNPALPSRYNDLAMAAYGRSLRINDWGLEFSPTSTTGRFSEEEAQRIFEHLGRSYRPPLFHLRESVILTPWSRNVGPAGLMPGSAVSPEGAIWRSRPVDGGVPQLVTMLSPDSGVESQLSFFASRRFGRDPAFDTHVWTPDESGLSHQSVAYDTATNTGGYTFHRWFVMTGARSMMSATSLVPAFNRHAPMVEHWSRY